MMKYFDNNKTMTITNPEILRALGESAVPREIYLAEPDGHKFRVGDTCELFGLIAFPEYNGTKVTITAIREDGVYGKAYYVEGEINQRLNWVYENRLKRANQ